MSEDDVRLTAWVHGRVQGVGFRWWTRCRALELGLTGYAANQADGRVLVVAQGPRAEGNESRTADALAGSWRMNLPAGFQREVLMRPLGANRVSVNAGSTMLYCVTIQLPPGNGTGRGAIAAYNRTGPSDATTLQGGNVTYTFTVNARSLPNGG